MSRFLVDPDALSSASGRCDGISSNIGSLAWQISDIKYDLHSDYSRYRGVISALDTCVSNSYRCRESVSRLGSCGKTISSMYMQAEASITGNITVDKFGNLVVNSAQGKDYSSIIDAIRKFQGISSLLTPSALVPASALLRVMDWLYGDEPTETQVKFTKKFKEWDDHKKDLKKIKKVRKDGKWVDEVDKDDDEGIEIDVKLKEWHAQNMPAKTWKHDDGEKSYLNGFANLSGSYDISKGETEASAYVGLLSAGATAGASYTVFSAEGKAELGNDYFGGYAKGNVEVLKAGAEGEASIGLYDKYGNFNPNAKLEASAEAILASASGTVGGKVLGADVGVTGEVEIGFDAHAKVGFDDGKLSVDIGAAVGVGGSVKLDIDLSKPINAVSDAARAVWSWFK